MCFFISFLKVPAFSQNSPPPTYPSCSPGLTRGEREATCVTNLCVGVNGWGLFKHEYSN